MSLMIFSFTLIALSILSGLNEVNCEREGDHGVQVADPLDESVVNAAKYFIKEYNKKQKDKNHTYKLDKVQDAFKSGGSVYLYNMRIELHKTKCEKEIVDGDADNCPVDPDSLKEKTVCGATIIDLYGHELLKHECVTANK